MAVMTRQQLVAQLNNSGLSQHLKSLQQAILLQATKQIMNSAGVEEDGESDSDIRKKHDRMLLDSVGPAAAGAAVEYAMTVNKESLAHLTGLNGHFVNNLKIIQNDSCEGYDTFGNTMRQFLMPRYAYLNFDMMVDPRHRIDEECGYPRYVTPIMYRYMYDRDDVSRRVVDIYSDESWAVDPEISDDDDENVETEFEREWKALCDDHNLLQFLYRIDKLSGIGHYGVLLLGLEGTDDLAKPVEEVELLNGVKKSVATKRRQMLYLRPFDEYLSFVQTYNTDVNSSRYGKPEIYNLVFLDAAVGTTGTSIGTRVNKSVHWSRVVHVADGAMSSLTMGTPRMQPVFNRLLDLRKIKGGSAEMFWKGAFPGISFEIDPRYAADEVEFDKDELRKEVQEYADGLRRFLTTAGVKANSLAPQVADPSNHTMVQLQAIACHYGVPLKVFLGSEEGRLQSSEDKLTWNQRLGRRISRFVNPEILKNVIWRLVAVGVLPCPKNKTFKISWPDLNSPTDEDKANLSLKWTQALSQYVATGIIHLVPPLDYLTMILGMSVGTAKKIIAEVEGKGGFAKLYKVDPSEGAGVNGKRQNIADKKDSGTSRSRPKKRNTADKKIEGASS